MGYPDFRLHCNLINLRGERILFLLHISKYHSRFYCLREGARLQWRLVSPRANLPTLIEGERPAFVKHTLSPVSAPNSLS